MKRCGKNQGEQAAKKVGNGRSKPRQPKRLLPSSFMLARSREGYEANVRDGPRNRLRTLMRVMCLCRWNKQHVRVLARV